MLPPDVRALQFGEIWTADANRNVAWKSLETKCGQPGKTGACSGSSVVEQRDGTVPELLVRFQPRAQRDGRRSTSVHARCPSLAHSLPRKPDHQVAGILVVVGRVDAACCRSE